MSKNFDSPIEEGFCGAVPMQSTGRDVPQGLKPDYYLAQDTIVSFAELEPCNDAGMDIQQMARELLESQRELSTAESLVRDLTRALQELCGGIEDGGGTDGNGDMFDLSEAIAALSRIPAHLRAPETTSTEVRDAE